jgi:hypothetical protein
MRRALDRQAEIVRNQLHDESSPDVAQPRRFRRSVGNFSKR